MNIFFAAFTKSDAWTWLEEYQPKNGQLDPNDPAGRKEVVERYLKAVLV